MCKELVRLTTRDVSKAIPVTDSLVIANKIDYPHYQITRLIKKHKDDFGEFGPIDFEKQLLNSKKVEVFLLTEGQFLLLVTYLRTTKKATKIKELKKQMVRGFLLMKNELQARQETRYIGIATRKSLTDTIENKTDNGTNFKKFAYSNYTKLVYKKILGKTVKKAKEERGLKKSDKLRDYLTIEELEKVQDLESKIAFYIEMRKDLTGNDKAIYQEIKEYIDKITN